MPTMITENEDGKLDGDYHQYLVFYSDKISTNHLNLTTNSLTFTVSSSASWIIDDSLGSWGVVKCLDAVEAQEEAAALLRNYETVVTYKADAVATLPVEMTPVESTVESI